MTVHTMRQITALQRANKRWQKRADNHLRVVPTPHRRNTLADRIAALGQRMDNSRVVWRVITAATVIGYIAYMVTHWPHT